MIIGVYKITNIIDNKCYIGSSINVKGRISQHKNQLKKNKHHSIKLQRAYDKYCIENFKYEIVEECTIENMIIREQYYIDFYDCCKNGYNIVPNAGHNLGMIHSDETKEILRQKSTGNKNNLGRIQTDETKKKISDKLKGTHLSDETKLKLSNSLKGRITTDETRLKQSKSQKGKKLSDETKLKLSILNKGKKQSKETIEKRVKKNTGQKRTDEVKLKMSKAMTGIKKGPMSYENKLIRSKRVAQISESGELIKEFDSVKKCAEYFNTESKRICEVLTGKKKYYKKKYFKYL